MDIEPEQSKKHDEVDKEKIVVTPRTTSRFEEELVEKASETCMPEVISPKVEKISSSFRNSGVVQWIPKTMDSN